MFASAEVCCNIPVQAALSFVNDVYWHVEGKGILRQGGCHQLRVREMYPIFLANARFPMIPPL